MLSSMRWALAILLALGAGQAAAQPGPKVVYAPSYAPYNPTAAYVTPGQDEPGYRAWYAGASWRPGHVKAFHDYLLGAGVAGVVPTWQLLRTASSWRKCGSQPFEVPPTEEWPHIVQTLRYINDYVVPSVGPVESVSGYRNAHLNVCAGGAPASAHKSYSAIDLVPLRATSREQLIQTLCSVHSREGARYGVGLGFYAYLRFHVDTTKYRRWGVATGPDCPPIIRPEDLASVAQPLEPLPSQLPAPGVDPLAPAAAGASATAGGVPAAPSPAPATTAVPPPRDPETNAQR